jgi:hypothetical protein
MANTTTKRIKKLMIDREIGYEALLPALAEKLDRPVSRQVLSMAVSGYRTGRAYQEIVEATHEILCAWPESEAT